MTTSPLSAGACINKDCPSDTQTVELGVGADGFTTTFLTCVLCDALWEIT
jgi:hypothetical protein